ncbi:hypothetical protein JIN85_03510 [Luteolibacter pohnpeiensis]|uniref:PEP-CTERM sorting domain-containing protein n=1 Tax=Luteolibacter pohnpeiensis TaxID=454153 RepID=A0A934VTG6_9BACT|nr:hypothetical protein [Luteolibacter pohnpeiensis]MBK1881467.1 hypothetical protein [Luteolibacter pohnpeiensis]
MKQFLKIIGLFGLLATSAAAAGPYAPAAGVEGTEAISLSDSRFVAWACGNWQPQYGTDVDSTWKTPEKAWGAATGDAYDIVCLGNGGSITLYFPNPICDGDGADFAVFENGFSNNFLELGFVEVSSNGVDFVRFPTASLTASAVGPFSITGIDPTEIDGFAGKYRLGFGTPFDLSKLPDSEVLDKNHIRFVRIVDIIGDGGTTDSDGRPIYDPTPTTGSGGFDLEAIGVIHQNDGEFRISQAELAGADFSLKWESNPGSSYRIERSDDLGTAGDEWIAVATVNGETASGLTTMLVPRDGALKRFWRVVRLEE